MTVMISVAVAIMAGLLMTRLTNLFRLPDVTAYLIAGVVIGPYCLGALGIDGLGFTSFDAIDALGSLSNLALGFIAFAIGNEFRLSQLKNTGRQAAVIGVVQAITATLFVDAALIGMHFVMPDQISVPAAITLGAIATATAPAATLMVVRQYKAKGRLTDILLPVVALDDAVGLVVFAVSFGIAEALKGGAADTLSIIVEPLLEIAASLILGAVMGWLLTQLEKIFHSNRNRMSLIISFVILTVALAMIKIEIGRVTLSFSALLVCMMLGTVFCNMCPLSGELMDKSDKWTAPLYALFFVLSGAGLDLGVFSNLAVVAVGAVYIICRSAGKYLGAYGSAAATGCEPPVKKYLGITLLPQAGVALGMCLTARELGGHDGNFIRNIVLFSVLVYELVGPMLTKIALTRAGDIKPKGEDVLNRREQQLKKASEKQ
ncbi:MAG: cation:proton antiporter [Oscillospiraceae bacterium]|nr:cation:proton antiporter [Oscillospiraceae bacterium]